MNMDYEEIKEMLEGRFQSGNNGLPQRIIFWMDEKAQFKDEIESFEMEGITVLIADQFNSFEIKYKIEYQAPTSRFLVYIPFKKPSDDKNILADMMYYSQPFFSADRESLMCDEMSIPIENIDIVKEHADFFKKAERRRKYVNLGIDNSNSKNIVLGMMCVISGSESYDFQSILKNVLCDYNDFLNENIDSDPLVAFDSFNLTSEFWKCCKEVFGINDDTMGGLVRTLFISCAYDKIGLKKEKKLQSYISEKSGRIHVFINTMYSDVNCCDAAESLSDHVSENMKIRDILDEFETKELMESDAFSCTDDILADRFIAQMNSTHKSLDTFGSSVIDRRLLLHCREMHRYQYSTIQYGSELLAEVQVYSSSVADHNDVRSLIEQYSKKWYKIDHCYRKFILNMDLINEKSSVLEIFIDFIENTYNNVFLNDITSRLCSKISGYKDLPTPYQTEFYDRNVKNTDKATVVIISDGMRFECASELQDILSKTSRIKETPKLTHMVSTLPSLTRFGMAALLPNNGLQVSCENHSVKINGMSTEMGSRREVLCSYNKDSATIKYDDLKVMKTEDLRTVCRGKRIVYVYHDKIDGPSHTAEQDIFKNCEQALKEIEDMITIITNRLSYTRFVITSDHGFLYRRRKLEELDKISLAGADESGRRYALAQSSVELDRSVKIPLDYLGPGNDHTAVFLPDCSGVYKVSGAGLNYVHGGLSLQEIIVPVLTVNTNKGKVVEDYVGLRVMNKPTIKKTNQTISIWQENGVSDKFREATYELCFEDDDGVPVSDVQTIIANKVDGHDMEYRIKFTMSIKRGTVHLKVRNKSNDGELCIDEEYQVQIMFTDLGGI